MGYSLSSIYQGQAGRHGDCRNRGCDYCRTPRSGTRFAGSRLQPTSQTNIEKVVRRACWWMTSFHPLAADADTTLLPSDRWGWFDGKFHCFGTAWSDQFIVHHWECGLGDRWRGVVRGWWTVWSRDRSLNRSSCKRWTYSSWPWTWDQRWSPKAEASWLVAVQLGLRGLQPPTCELLGSFQLWYCRASRWHVQRARWKSIHRTAGRSRWTTFIRAGGTANHIR